MCQHIIRMTEHDTEGDGTDMTGSGSVSDLASVIGPIAYRCNVTAVFLFGFRACGEHMDGSDYDLPIEVNGDYCWDGHMGFTEPVSAALARDVVTRRSLRDDNFPRTVQREMVRICRRQVPGGPSGARERDADTHYESLYIASLITCAL